jgi:hypothetical protein
MSFANLFAGSSEHGDKGLAPIAGIEIPIIQRDYAQGRQDASTARIRAKFLDVLHRAVMGGEPVTLDFIYGELLDGKLIPLDGQQRLTTLFLLHWYLAARADVPRTERPGWQAFTYETRVSSRLFCQRLVRHRPPFPLDGLSAWIRDQSWYFAAWRHDATIGSMLVVLDAIHALFRDSDCDAAWGRLVDPSNPVITFHFLPIEQMGLTDDLYIKMNSRGKPLTPFEHFKADFERTLKDVHLPHYEEFISKIDNDWSDLLWPLRGDNNIIDDEFMRYFRFVTEVRALLTGVPLTESETTDEVLAERVYGPGNAGALANQRWLFDALDCWSMAEPSEFFATLLAADGHQEGKLALFADRPGGLDVNLFAACCEEYGESDGRRRRFSLQRTLLLFAMVVHLLRKTDSFTDRLRTVRNLVEGSDNEVRFDNMRSLLHEVEGWMREGDLAKIKTFNTRQLREEAAKIDFLAAHPECRAHLHRLEDHTLLRGRLAIFDLVPGRFERHAEAFEAVFTANLSLVSAAMLACGDYGQELGGSRYQLGSPTQPARWRELLRGVERGRFEDTKAAVTALLDTLADAGATPPALALQQVIDTFLAEQDRRAEYDWRYYVVRYPQMRQGESGIYVEDAQSGFSLRMLLKTYTNSKYRDPYLQAIIALSGAVVGRDVREPWFTGYDVTERWTVLLKSGVELRCTPSGFLLRRPTRDEYSAAFGDLMAKEGVDASLAVTIPQVPQDDPTHDTRDRVQVGADLLRKLLALQPAPAAQVQVLELVAAE